MVSPSLGNFLSFFQQGSYCQSFNYIPKLGKLMSRGFKKVIAEGLENTTIATLLQDGL